MPGLRSRWAASPGDVASCLRLRAEVIGVESGLGLLSLDGREERDEFDERFDHLMVLDEADALVATCRGALLDRDSLTSERSYLGSKLYDLRGLRHRGDQVAVMSRVAVRPERRTAETLRFLVSEVIGHGRRAGRRILLVSFSMPTERREDGWRLFRTLRAREVLHPAFLFPSLPLASCGPPALEIDPSLEGALPLPPLHELAVRAGGRFASYPSYHPEYGGGSVEVLAWFEDSESL